MATDPDALTRALRRALTAIDAIKGLDVPVEERIVALLRIGEHERAQVARLFDEKAEAQDEN